VSGARTGTGWRPLLRVWAPTAFGNSILTVEIPAVAAIVARAADGTAALAGFGVALTVILVLNSPALPLASTVAVLGDSPAAFARLQLFALGLGLTISAALTAFLLSSRADLVLGAVLGLPAHVAELARQGLLGLALAPLVVSWRRCCHGLLIRTGRTAGMAYGSAARILVSISLGSVGVLVVHLPAALAGAAALTAGATVEALVVTWWALALRARLPATSSGPLRLAAVLRFHAPLAAAYVLSMLPQGLVTAGMARALDVDASLAAWPVVYGAAWILAGAAIEVESITASQAGGSASPATVRRFAWALGGGLSLVALLLAVPAVGGLYFGGVSGLRGAPAELAVHAMPLVACVPLLVALRAWLRGRLLAAGRTLRVQAAMAVALAALVLVLVAGDAAWRTTGLTIGALAYSVYLACEVLGLWLAQAGPAAAPRVAAAAGGRAG
jgi:hypothetical protein